MEHHSHSVVVEFGYGSTDIFPIIDLEDRLIEALECAGAGELEGNDLTASGDEGSLYFCGQDPEAVLEAIRPVIMGCPLLHHPRAVVRCRADSDSESEFTDLRVVQLA